MARSVLAIALVCAAGTPALAQSFTFDDVTAGSGLDYELARGLPGVFNGASASADDFDGDGWLDVVICGGSDASPQIFRNTLGERGPGSLGASVFVNVTSRVMPADAEPASHAILADMDNDGDADLVVARRYPGPTGVYSWNDVGMMMYENLGGRRFARVPTPFDLARWDKALGSMALADLDVDGDLDVVLTHNGTATIGGGGAGFLVRNDGMQLVDATAAQAPSLSNVRRYFQVVLADFDGDNVPDLHSAVDLQSDFHCRNRNHGKMVNVTNQAGTSNGGSDMGIGVGDIENDGDYDIFSTNIAEGVLYVNNGSGVFTNQAQNRGVGLWQTGPQASIGWGTAFVDIDHDTDQDLLFVGFGAPGQMFENDGNGFFTEVTPPNVVLSGHGLLPFDYDKDGDVDFLVIPQSGTNARPTLYANTTPAAGTHWLEVVLQGTRSNRDGIGAKVEVVVGSTTMTRPVMHGSSFKNGPPRDVHFGLGGAPVADQVRVTWPSGRVTTLTNVRADRLLKITEPAN